MEAIWTGAARIRQRDIITHIAEADPDAALGLLDTFEEGARNLERFPSLGRPGRVAGTRELQVHKHYFLVYEIRDDKIYILSIWHTSRQYPVSS